MTTGLLRLENIKLAFGGITTLSNVSCEVPKGQIVGVIGPNGAGKTSLFNVITGAYRANSGSVTFDGRTISGLPPHLIARAGVIRTFQNIRLFASKTVWEHLLIAQVSASLPSRLLPTHWIGPASRQRAEEALEFFGLTAFAHRLARSLSYGVQRKVEMARALVAQPKLLLLDEPVAGMNHEEAQEIRGLLERLRAIGITQLVIEHDMNFIMPLCDRLYVLDFGHLIAQGTPTEVRNDPAVLDAYLGREA